VDCGSNTASLSWDASPNAISYSGSAVGTDGHSVSCGAATPGCQMAGLHCGQEYVFTVSASDGSCESPESNTFTQETGERDRDSVFFFCSVRVDITDHLFFLYYLILLLLLTNYYCYYCYYYWYYLLL
jgi:hypothetical protein